MKLAGRFGRTDEAGCLFYGVEQTVASKAVTGRNGSIVTLAKRPLWSRLVFLEHYKLNIPTADGDEFTLPTRCSHPFATN
jgi:hypothetical protein